MFTVLELHNSLKAPPHYTSTVSLKLLSVHLLTLLEVVGIITGIYTVS